MSQQLSILDAIAPTNRADQILAHFERFFKDNPKVWELFQRFALQETKSREHYSANAIFERIRLHVGVETASDEAVRMNNNYRSYYARLFMLAHPEHDGFFKIRKRISEDKPAQENDITVYDTGPADQDDETRIRSRLTGLITGNL